MSALDPCGDFRGWGRTPIASAPPLGAENLSYVTAAWNIMNRITKCDSHFAKLYIDETCTHSLTLNMYTTYVHSHIDKKHVFESIKNTINEYCTAHTITHSTRRNEMAAIAVSTKFLEISKLHR